MEWVWLECNAGWEAAGSVTLAVSQKLTLNGLSVWNVVDG